MSYPLAQNIVKTYLFEEAEGLEIFASTCAYLYEGAGLYRARTPKTVNKIGARELFEIVKEIVKKMVAGKSGTI